MDAHRLMRALQARRLRDVEERRRLVVDGKMQPDTLTPDEWRLIRENDRIVGDLHRG